MITISRAVAHRVRSVFRRALGVSQKVPVWLRFVASADGLQVQTVHDQVAIEFRLAGPLEPEVLLVPLELLAACESKNCQEPVQLRQLQHDNVMAEWCDKVIPQQFTSDKPPETRAEFPKLPGEMSDNGSALLPALAAASGTTDAQSSRFALGCLNLRGETGSIAATDGCQLLVQRGWRFPWQADVLVPANRVFAAPELAVDQPVQVGQAGDWVVFRTGPWSICLHIQKDARFPKVDDLVRNAEAAASRLTIPAADAEFAIDALKRLPVGDDDSNSVTLDLNGEVLLRSRPDRETPATELHLVNSCLKGTAVRLVSKRTYLARALALGFTDFSLFGPTAILQANDERRQYIWMPWSVESAVLSEAGTRRIASRISISVRAKRTTRITTHPAEVVSATVVEPPTQPQETMPQTEDNPKPSGSPIEQVSELRNALHDVLTRTNEVLRSLKRQRKQSRLVESTLQSLKQLQQVA